MAALLLLSAAEATLEQGAEDEGEILFADPVDESFDALKGTGQFLSHHVLNLDRPVLREASLEEPLQDLRIARSLGLQRLERLIF